MNIKEKYNLWLTFDENTKKELESVTDEKETEDRFYKDLEFGTGGLRGIMGAGTNRMNSYTVGRASLGFAKYLKDKYNGEISVAIACDSRLNSSAFEWDSARVFASQGIKVYAYTKIVPVPMLSFATRYLHCNAGVMITASHNQRNITVIRLMTIPAVSFALMMQKKCFHISTLLMIIHLCIMK